MFSQNLLEKSEDILKHLLMGIYYSHNLDTHENGKWIMSLYFNDLYEEFVSIYDNHQGSSDYDVFIKCIGFLFYRESLPFDHDTIEELYEMYTLDIEKFSSKHLVFFKNINLEKYHSLSYESSEFGTYLDSALFDSFRSFIKMAITTSFREDKSYSEKQIDEYLSKRYKKIMKLSINNGTHMLPHNLGSIIIGSEKTNDSKVLDFVKEYKKVFPRLISEGVTMSDIVYWWNQPDVYRYVIYDEDNLKLKFHVLQALNIDCGYLSVDEKFEKVKINNPLKVKDHIVAFHLISPIFEAYEYNHSWLLREVLIGVNRPLPYELKDRVLRYLTKIGYEKLYMMLQKKGHKSVNAFIREKILANEI